MKEQGVRPYEYINSFFVMLRTGEIGDQKGGLRGDRRARQIRKRESKERSRKGKSVRGLNMGTFIFMNNPVSKYLMMMNSFDNFI